jgi:hypothetical protein
MKNPAPFGRRIWSMLAFSGSAQKARYKRYDE